MKRVRLSASLLLLGLMAATPGFGATPGFSIAHRVLIGGEGGWDALTVDSENHRLYVSHSTRVEVVDTRTDSLIGAIPDTPKAHDIALAPEFERGFISNGADSTVTVFDLRSLKVLARIPVGARSPDAIEYDPVSKRVFCFNGGSDNATAIDARSHRIVGTLALDGKPEFAAADGKGMVYVNLEDSSVVLAFDARTFEIKHRWPLAPGEKPSGFAIDRQHRRLFSGCHNQTLVVLDAYDGHLVATLPIGRHVDGVAFDPVRQLIFSSNGDGTLTVIHEDDRDQFTVVENAVTQQGARTCALDENTGTVYLPVAQLQPPGDPTPEQPHPHWTVVPGTFTVLEMRR